jgi:hypothetical protein
MITAMPERLLVNYWYARPVGHAIEGLRYALGYHVANPEMKVSLLLNAATPVELAQCCPFLDEMFAVPFTDFTRVVGDPVAALADVPREWDYVIDNYRAYDRGHDRIEGFRSFFDSAHEHLEPRHGFGVSGAEPPAYAPDQQLRLELPEGVRETAHQTLGADRRAISVILAGHSDPRSFYPSESSWELILGELSARHPEAAILLIGKLGPDDIRSTSTITRAEVERLLSSCPAAVDCFDRPLLEQLALVEASDLFLSPHTGFAFAALAVGTPWLALSGGPWHEYFFNGVPFYSVLPDARRYPCFTWDGRMEPVEDEDGEGPRTPSMTVARVREDLPELLHAANLLIEERLPYEDALAGYFPRLLDAYGGDGSRIFTFDNIHERYLRSAGGGRSRRVAPTTARISLPPSFQRPRAVRALRRAGRGLRRAVHALGRGS